MRSRRVMRSIAVAAVAALTLGGCSVPGQGTPGVAAVYRDIVITQADVDAMSNLLGDLHSSPHPGEALTLLLLGPEAVSIAEDLGVEWDDASLLADGVAWIAALEKNLTADQLQQIQNGLNADDIEVVKMVRALAYDLHDAEGIVRMLALVKDVAANTTTSPRYGEFTVDNFSVSISEIDAYLVENQAGLGPAAFLAFKDVDGFTAEALPEWLSSG